MFLLCLGNAFFHIDDMTNVASIQPIIDALGPIIKKELGFNGNNYKIAPEQKRIMHNVANIQHTLNLSFAPNEYGSATVSPLGSVSIIFEKDSTTRLIVGSVHMYQGEFDTVVMQSYPEELFMQRGSIYEINKIFGNSSNSPLLDIIILYSTPKEPGTDWMGGYTPLPRLLAPGLREDLLRIRSLPREDMITWFLNDETVNKYPCIDPYRTAPRYHLVIPFFDDYFIPTSHIAMCRSQTGI